MEQISTETYRKFRAFLKRHDVYEDFMNEFIAQKYEKVIHHKKNSLRLRPNFVNEMTSHFETDTGQRVLREYKALSFSFECFKWASGNKAPIRYTQYWCTLLGVKWGLYCIKNNIPICEMRELARLLRWWDRNKWIDTTKLTLFEKALIRQILSTN